MPQPTPTSRRRLVVAVLSVVLTLAAGCAGDSPAVPAGPDGRPDPVLVEGREIFSRQCVNCHGTDGGGGQGPKLKDGAVVEAYPDVLDQIAVVTDGRNVMPSFSNALSDAEIEAVVRYTREVL